MRFQLRTTLHLIPLSNSYCSVCQARAFVRVTFEMNHVTLIHSILSFPSQPFDLVRICTSSNSQISYDKEF
uniref:Putative ovule protein n=1 Tax=Solanum chacoense TaxID=4108 RepID=A0A0V0INH5_SOLCH